MAQSIEKLEEIINNPKSKPEAVAIAKKQLEGLTAISAAKTNVTAQIMGETAQLDTILSALQSLISSGVGGGLNEKEIKKAIRQELKAKKVDFDDLSDYLKGFLDNLKSVRNVQITINAMDLVTQVTSSGDPILNRKITQLILSDSEARNNVYLYGGAGTGKTFIARYIAKLLTFEPFILNCNQYTSPLDILGGQTIDGYQQGKLVQAWGNFIEDKDGNRTPVKGAVLILDELPKIDPNTAGILNEALANVKQFSVNKNTGALEPPVISDGRNEKFNLGNLVVIATGNVPLNTIDPDYEANFKQDLSLQDRFIGSTYKVFVDYDYEFNVIMKGFAFIWLFGTKLRQAIESPEIRATSQAFVSIRLMENLRETYKVYRNALLTNETAAQTGNESILSKPKTIIEGIDTVLALIKESQRKQIVEKVGYEGFKRIVERKNSMPYDKAATNFDTPEEIEEANKIIEAYKQEQANKI
jgi:cobaltochelatase CobS